MRKRILYIGALIFLSCSSGKGDHEKKVENSPIDDTVIYSVINSILNDSLNINTRNISLKLEMPFIFFSNSDSAEIIKSKIFSIRDIEYIKSQKIDYLAFGIDTSKIEDKYYLFLDFENIDSVKKYFSISRPVFNEEHTICIIRKSYYCGAFCGKSGLYIYKKNNTGWQLHKVISEAVS